MKVKLTQEDAQEVMHKIGVLADSPDLCEDYSLTNEQAEMLRDSIPNGGEWEVPEWAQEAVRGEMANHCEVLDGISADARDSGERGQALRIAKQARRLERLFA